MDTGQSPEKKLRIVFMGTPAFAVPMLIGLMDAGYHIVAVITAPDKPAGRGLQIQYSDVKKAALEYDIPVLQPVNLKDPEFIKTYQALSPDLNVVVAFRMLPEVIWRCPRLGTFNLHASLLPQYRGAAPINWAIINGETETGLTTFFIDKEIDTGKIILQEKLPVSPNETAGELHDRMMIMGAEMVLKTVKLIENQEIDLTEQAQLIDKYNIKLKSAPKISKETCRVNWSASLQSIYNLIRGLSPSPSAFTMLVDSKGVSTPLKIYSCSIKFFSNAYLTGSLDTDNKTYLAINHPEGQLFITELQLAGRKRLKVADFLRGLALLTPEWHVV